MLADILSGRVKANAELKPFVDFDVLAEAEKRLTSEQAIPIPDPGQLYRASGIARVCSREEVLRFVHKAPKVSKIEPKLQRTFDFGHAFHDLVQNKWFGDWGWLVGNWECRRCGRLHKNSVKPAQCADCSRHDFAYKEFEFLDKEHGIIGHCDGIIEINGSRKLIELKTCNANMFKYITEIRCDALDDHKEQINTYMWLSGVHFGAIIYLDKDESQWRQFPQHFDKARMDKTLQKIRDARDGMRSKIAPSRTVCAKLDCARAKACSVRALCFKTE